MLPGTQRLRVDFFCPIIATYLESLLPEELLEDLEVKWIRVEESAINVKEHAAQATAATEARNGHAGGRIN